ncbi:MAG: hypothetical protein IJR82_04925 [Bacilli bacterium]|nr:hypothetical protein [Bacilli bacterium]
MKSKKSIIILSLIAIVGIVGVTVAYFSDSYSFSNEFKTKEYGTTVKEKFISPEAWTPGTTTEKKLKVKNSGTIDEAVRVSYSESWVNKNGDELPLKQGDNVVAIINWTNQRDWIQDGNTFYYKYVLAPQEETSTLIDSVTYNIAVESEISCTETTEGNVKSKTCSSSGEGYDDATYTLTFTIETVQFDKYKEAWSTNIVIAGTKPMDVSTLISKSNPVTISDYNDGDVHQMYTFNRGATDQMPSTTEYRYIGDDPYNYIEFNCDDEGANCEIWRIIGIFDVDDGDGHYEQRIKLVRGFTLPVSMDTYAWDEREYEGYDGTVRGKNDWNGAYINTYLNGNYYDSFSETSKNLIKDAIYYLGGRTSSDPVEPEYGTTEEIYIWERGTTVYNQNEATRPINSKNLLALMYPSDVYMVYANGVNSTCYDDPLYCYDDDAKTGWIYNSNKESEQEQLDSIWLISPDSATSYRVFNVSENGYLFNLFNANNAFSVRPVVYLVPDVEISSGDGSPGSPYKLSVH